MNKKQRHRAKIAKRKKRSEIASALRLGFGRWSQHRPPIRNVKSKGGEEVRERLATYLIEAIPAAGTKTIRGLVEASVGVTPTGVYIDFEECARRIVDVQERRA